MVRKVNVGVSTQGLVALVFSVLGGIYTLLGTVFLFAGDGVMSLVGAVFAALGVVFLVVSGILLGVAHRKKKQAQALMERGRYIWAEVIDWSVNRGIQVNGRPYHNLIAKYVDGRGMVHVFKSGNLRIFRDPGIIGKSVRVYYSDDSFQTYYVDAQPLLDQYIEH